MIKLVSGAIVVALALMGPMVVPAGAHAGPLSADPQPCEVASNTAEIRVRFSDELLLLRSTITVVDSAGVTVAEGSVDLDDLARDNLVAVPTGALALGEYKVMWEVVSALDGDATQGSYTFAVGNPSLESTSEPVECEFSENNKPGRGSLLVPVVSVALVVIAIVAARTMRKKSEDL